MGILIKNGNAVIDGVMTKTDILINGSKIVKIAPSIELNVGDELIDADNKVVMPGLIDMHCHLREPGYEYKEDIETGTRAALRGGFTAIACMPNTNPVLDNAALIRYVDLRATESGYAKVYPIGCITKGQKGEELAEMGLMKEAGAIAFSDDGRPVEDARMMCLGMEYAAGLNALIISHCEDKSLSGDGVVNEGINSTIAGLKGISRSSEEVMVSREIILAETLKSKIHIAHVSTRGSVELVRAAKARGVSVTAETCPHYISATDDEILSYNTCAKINPPLRTSDDVEALIEGLKDGTIDVIATDHAPHHIDEKNREFDTAPFGSTGFETAFAICYTYLVKSGHMTLPELVQLMSVKPAKILQVEGGELIEGATADIAIADVFNEYDIDVNKHLSKSRNCVFNGWRVCGNITETIVDGRKFEF